MVVVALVGCLPAPLARVKGARVGTAEHSKAAAASQAEADTSRARLRQAGRRDRLKQASRQEGH